MKYSIHIIILCFVLLAGCKEMLQVDTQEELVIEGYIEAGGFPVVMVSTSMLPSEMPVSIDSLEDHIVRWAKVKVSDGTNEVFLTGMRSKNHFPPYIYTTTAIRGEEGKKYALSVDYGTVHAEAQTIIPKSVPIDDVRVEPSSDTLSKIFIRFTDPEDKNWYRLFVKVQDSGDNYLPSLFGLSDDSGFSGKSEMRVRRGYGNKMRNYQVDFRDGEFLDIKLATCTEDMYQYWKVFENNMFYGRIPFFPATESMQGNISGAQGYWAGYGISAVEIQL